MSTDRLTNAALALPMEERVRLAQPLWVSIDKDLAETSESAAVEESARRADELDRGAEQGQPHEDAMRQLRQGLHMKRLG
jgi:putative addiction module component (TIGR02574 family)